MYESRWSSAYCLNHCVRNDLHLLVHVASKAISVVVSQIVTTRLGVVKVVCVVFGVLVRLTSSRCGHLWRLRAGGRTHFGHDVNSAFASVDLQGCGIRWWSERWCINRFLLGVLPMAGLFCAHCFLCGSSFRWHIYLTGRMKFAWYSKLGTLELSRTWKKKQITWQAILWNIFQKLESGVLNLKYKNWKSDEIFRSQIRKCWTSFSYVADGFVPCVAIFVLPSRASHCIFYSIGSS